MTEDSINTKKSLVRVSLYLNKVKNNDLKRSSKLSISLHHNKTQLKHFLF